MSLHPATPDQHNPKVSMVEAAEILGCSTKTVRRYLADGSLTGSRMGPRLIRVDMTSVHALLNPIDLSAF